jgi:amidase
MAHPDFAHLTLAELVTAIEEGATSAVEATTRTIERIERLDPLINAVPVRDFERALAQAERLDRDRPSAPGMPLLGAPITVKESFHVAGLPTTWGIPAYKDFRPTADAVAVARLKAAGAIVVGKTNVPVALGDLQTYNPLYGRTNNPWDLSRTPGGSSGGSAAALASGFGVASLGSDIAGSLRVPAHFTGTYAHKPSFGLLPTRGHVAPPSAGLDYFRDLSVVGPMARSASDLRLLIEVLTTPAPSEGSAAVRTHLPRPRHPEISQYRVLIIRAHPAIATSHDVEQAVDTVASTLEHGGARVAYESTLLPDPMHAAGLYMRLLLASVASGYPPAEYDAAVHAAGRLDPADRSLAAERVRGAGLSYRDWIAADAERARLREQWRAVFAEFDVIVCPVSPTVAFTHDQSDDQWSRTVEIDGVGSPYADQLVWSGMATAPGLPATVMPVGLSSRGLPVGVQLIGPMLEDRTPLHLAELLEREGSWVSAVSPTELVRS